MNRRLYIDGDPLVYESAFAAQKTRYHYLDLTFEDSDQCKAYCLAHELDYRDLRQRGQIGTTVELLPETVARAICRMKLDAVIQSADTDDSLVEIYLSGDHNYRDEVAKTKGYKANRANVVKPHHYQFCRNWMIEHGAMIVPGIEADDALGICMTEDKEGILATIDKDLNQIPGRHIDWGHNIKYRVGDADAHYFFLHQLLTGDTTDNIPGIPGLGEAKATKILAPVRGQKPAMWKAVLGEYNKGPFRFKDGSNTGYPADYLAEQMLLLWVQRYGDQRITPEEYTTRYIA